jgi:AcrR family transcriptional regulator
MYSFRPAALSQEGITLARMAVGRTTHLTKEEVAREALALFDEPDVGFSMRALATRLHVSPGALYNYFEDQAELVQAAVSLVWEESIADMLTIVADPVGDPGDPVEFLVAAAVCARRAFGRHYRIAPNLALPPPQGDSRLAGSLAIFGSLLESAGLHGDDVGEAFFAYTTYTLGAILYRSHRRLATERFGVDPDVHGFSSAAARPDDAPAAAPETLDGVDRAIALVDSDEEAEERMFAAGLRRLLDGFGVRSRVAVAVGSSA